VKDRVARHRSRYIGAPLPPYSRLLHAPQRLLRHISIRTAPHPEPSKAMTTHLNITTTAIQNFRHASTGGQHDHPPMASEPHNLRNEGSRPSQTRAAKGSTAQRRDAPRA
jgi:hypothetical protein